jgi:hypothetical protein
MNKYFKRISVLMLSTFLLIGLLPGAAFADEPSETPVAYTISYYKNDGSAGDLLFADQVDEGTEYTVRDISSVPLRQGWTLAGWSLQRETFVPVDANSFTVTGNREFFAFWYLDGIIVSPTYSVEYDINGGYGKVPVDSNKYKSGFKVTVKTSPTPKHKTLVFDGWALTPKGDIVKSFSITGNTVLYARWVKPEPVTKPKKDTSKNDKVTSPSTSGSTTTGTGETGGTSVGSKDTQPTDATDPVDPVEPTDPDTTTIDEQETPLISDPTPQPNVYTPDAPNFAVIIPVVVIGILFVAGIVFVFIRRNNSKKQQQ